MLMELFILKGFKEDEGREYEAARATCYSHFPSDEEIISFIEGNGLSRAEVSKSYNVIGPSR